MIEKQKDKYFIQTKTAYEYEINEFLSTLPPEDYISTTSCANEYGACVTITYKKHIESYDE